MLALFQVLVVLALSWVLAWHVAPRLFQRLGRFVGIHHGPSPITERRLARFRRIRRGHWSFRIIVTALVASGFLELTVTGRALVVHYDDHTAFPAVAEWLDTVLFFVDVPSFQKKSDFGQIGESEVDYRLFAEWVDQPDRLAREIDRRRNELDTARSLLETERPPEDAGDFDRRRFERAGARLARDEEELATLRRTLEVYAKGDAWILMPPYPWGPSDLRHDLAENPPNSPSLSRGIPLGTDLAGRDVVPLMLYGFRISLLFALVVAGAGYAVGIVAGGIQGYYGGWIDIASQRLVEIWGSIPFLFTIMIIASIVTPSFGILVVLMVVLQSWLGITYYVRGEFYREKAKDYVQAAIGSGVADHKIILRHILPNALVPVVTFAPFGIVAYIGALVALDYLGFGLPPGTPSWGALLRQGLENVKFYPHLTIIPTAALATTLYAVVMIGEAVREAFDPKVFSRLR
jgi:microcin C transport system permease protein